MARRAPEEPRPLAVDDSEHPGHTHRLPRALLLTLVIICAGLVVSIGLASRLAMQAQTQADETNRRLTALEQFIAERGEVRDDQYKTLDERINRKICDTLEALPAGGLLDEVRAENGCGPGVPIEDLSPEAQADLQRYDDGLPLTTTDDPFDVQDYYAEPDTRFPATPEADRKAPRTPQESTSAPSPTPTAVAPPVAPEQPTAAPTSSAPPLSRLTDRLCALTGVCP